MLQYRLGEQLGRILIRGARQLLTLRGPQAARRGSDLNEVGIVADGALLIRDGVIEQVGPSRRVENLAGARDALEINAAGRVVLPGFIDSHTHLVFPPPENTPAELEDAVRIVRTATAKRLIDRTRVHLQAMARHGTTTVEAKTGCAMDSRAEFKLLRVLHLLGREPVDVVATVLMRMPENLPPGGNAAQAVTDWYLNELLPRVNARKLARFVAVAWNRDSTLHPFFRLWIEGARARGLGCKIHAGRDSAGAAVAMATDQLVSTVDHLEHATGGEAAPLAGSPVIATLLPYAAFRRRSEAPPARNLIDSGAPVALASDFSVGQTTNVNMQVVVALACLDMDMTPAEAISAATINGAHALGCAGRTGSLEVGKAADLLVLNVSDYREIAHNFGTNLVHLTMKRGEFIYQEGNVARRSVAELHPNT